MESEMSTNGLALVVDEMTDHGCFPQDLSHAFIHTHSVIRQQTYQLRKRCKINQDKFYHRPNFYFSSLHLAVN
jgi:hypothetical protein